MRKNRTFHRNKADRSKPVGAARCNTPLQKPGKSHMLKASDEACKWQPASALSKARCADLPQAPQPPPQICTPTPTDRPMYPQGKTLPIRMQLQQNDECKWADNRKQTLSTLIHICRAKNTTGNFVLDLKVIFGSSATQFSCNIIVYFMKDS